MLVLSRELCGAAVITQAKGTIIERRSGSELWAATQAYYMAAPFAVERAPTVALCCPLKHRTVHVALLKDYPVSSSLISITFGDSVL